MTRSRKGNGVRAGMSANVEENLVFVAELATPLDQRALVQPIVQIIVHHDGWQNVHIVATESFDLDRTGIFDGLRTGFGKQEIICGHFVVVGVKKNSYIAIIKKNILFVNCCSAHVYIY
jgi:hypothetical protein